MSKMTYQIQIALKNSKPKIWRRILVASDTLLPDFHKIIQTTMGWTNSHLHQFIKNRNFYAPKLEDDFWDILPITDYANYKISHLLKKEKQKMLYEYDFGEGWVHEIILEKIVKNETNQNYPICLTGKNNCPPEDCGGIGGYYNMLKILQDPKDEEYEEYIEWLGDEFDPTYFDKDEINEMLKTTDFGCVDFF